MKYFKNPIRIFDDSTLEYKGTYQPNDIIIPDEPICIFSKKSVRIFLWVLIFMIGFLCGIIMHLNESRVKYKNECEALKEQIEVAEFDRNLEVLAGKYATYKGCIPENMQEVYKMCVESGAWYPEVIMAQFIIESGSGTSQLARHANNCYGMKKVGSKGRPNLQVPNTDRNGYGMYVNWQHSILDRVLWDEWFFKKVKPASLDEYLNKIDRVYAEDPNYIAKIKTVMKNWGN